MARLGTPLRSIVLSVHRHAVDAAELEAAHGVPGKYTEGLMMREWSACDEDEDVVTMALTAVRRLVERCGVRWEDIGMLQVGSALHAITVCIRCARLAFAVHMHMQHAHAVHMHTHCTRTAQTALETHRWAPSRCSTAASRSRAT